MAIQREWIDFLEARKWFVKPTHGSMYQAGFPDLYATHEEHGGKWIEVKLPDMEGSRFTKAQKEEFPKFAANGTPIWILTRVTEQEYRKLFNYPDGNWLEYFTIHHW